VLGGAGYIGSVVSQGLCRSGYEVVVFDSLSTGHADALPRDAVFVHADIVDGQRLEDTFRKHNFDAVMYFAGLIQAGESMRLPGIYFANNIANVITVLNLMIKHEVVNFVFSSSAAVYGNPSSVPIDESALTCPTNPYGESKLMVEQLLKWYGSQCGLRYASLRYFNAAGAEENLGEDHQPETHLIPLALNAAIGSGPPLTVYGTDYPTPDGTCIRDYIHVLDLADAHVLALEQVVSGETLTCNLGNGKGFSVREVVDAVRSVTGMPMPVVEGPRRPGDPAELVASSDRAKQLLGWQPKLDDLGDIVETAWRWKRSHPKGYQK